MNVGSEERKWPGLWPTPTNYIVKAISHSSVTISSTNEVKFCFSGLRGLGKTRR
jgi:hypothetical protein